MTEDVLNAAILRMRAKALENFALIKDLYHRPATRETVDQICSLSLALAQYEGAMITLQHAANLSSLTENEKKHTIVEMQKEVEEPEAEEPDELEDPEEPDKKVLSGEELAKRSPTNRRTSARSKRAKSKTKEEE